MHPVSVAHMENNGKESFNIMIAEHILDPVHDPDWMEREDVQVEKIPVRDLTDLARNFARKEYSIVILPYELIQKSENAKYLKTLCGRCRIILHGDRENVESRANVNEFCMNVIPTGFLYSGDAYELLREEFRKWKSLHLQKQKDDLYQLVMENESILYLRLTEDLRILDGNRGMERITGIPSDELQGRNFFDICVRGANCDEFHRTLHRMNEEIPGSEFDLHLVHGSKQVSVHLRFYREIDSGFHVLGKDLSREDRIRNRLIQNSRRLEKVQKNLSEFIQFSPAPIIGLDREGGIEYWNEALEELTGIPESQIKGKKIQEVLLDAGAPLEQVNSFLHELETEGRGDLEIAILSKFNKEVGILLTVFERVNSSGQKEGHWCIAHDVTDIQKRRQFLEAIVHRRTNDLQASLEREIQLTQDLKLSLEKAEELNELKTRFISMVSHEFRTPLSTIQTASDLLFKYYEKLTEEMRIVRFQKIQSSIRNMVGLLDDVLNLSRADSGQLSLHSSELDLGVLCQEVLEEQSESRPWHNIEYRAGERCDTIYSDVRYVRHIISNLVSNALKYTPAGKKITVEVECDESGAVISIQDQGIGIPEEDRGGLFQPFYRARNVGDIQGTGLGLAIVKRFANLLGGDIYVESELGEGSTFTVILPAREEVVV